MLCVQLRINCFAYFEEVYVIIVIMRKMMERIAPMYDTASNVLSSSGGNGSASSGLTSCQKSTDKYYTTEITLNTFTIMITRSYQQYGKIG